MPRFFFDIHDGDTHHTDDEGSELPDWEAARQEATGVLPNIARDRLPDGDRWDFICDVRDEGGQVIYTATLSLVARWLKQPQKQLS